MTITLQKDMPDRSRIVATVRTTDGYFSLTGELFEPHGTWSGAARQRNDKDCDACGQITDDVLSAFPQLAPFAALHLSDAQTGVPMHAVANSVYLYGLGDHEAACRTLRVDSMPDGLDDEGVATFANEQRARWASEAAAGRALLASLES